MPVKWVDYAGVLPYVKYVCICIYLMTEFLSAVINTGAVNIWQHLDLQAYNYPDKEPF